MSVEQRYQTFLWVGILLAVAGFVLMRTGIELVFGLLYGNESEEK